MNPRKPAPWLLLTGIAGPALFAFAVIVGGALRDGYSHRNQFISELGESGAPFAWLMNYFGFMGSATLILIFAVVLRTRFPRTAASVAGTLFLSIFAVCVFLAGIFSCDSGCPTENGTRAQQLHDLVSVIAFPAFILGVATWGVSFLRHADWRPFGLYSVATSVLAVILLVLMIRSEASRENTGTYQSLFLGVLFLWLIAASWRLWRRYGSGERERAA